jgi:hypothetical protein
MYEHFDTRFAHAIDYHKIVPCLLAEGKICVAGRSGTTLDRPAIPFQSSLVRVLKKTSGETNKSLLKLSNAETKSLN